MPKVSSYLHFDKNAEEAFSFYRSIFGGEFSGQGILRYGDTPPQEGAEPLTEEVRRLVMHIELPIMGGHILMGSDAPASMGFKLLSGNSSHIMLEPDSAEETRRLFQALSAGGQVETPLENTFWGALYGACTDRFGVSWMFNCQNQESRPEKVEGERFPIAVSALVKADLERAWFSYTDPRCVTRWNFASPDWRCPWAKNDLRAGGFFSFRMESKDGKAGFDFSGVYESVVANAYIAYRMDDGRRAHILFHPFAGGVLVTVSFDPEGENSMELQRKGWQAILDNFKTFAESGITP
jgi:PhnB protein